MLTTLAIIDAHERACSTTRRRGEHWFSARHLDNPQSLLQVTPDRVGCLYESSKGVHEFVPAAYQAISRIRLLHSGSRNCIDLSSEILSLVCRRALILGPSWKACTVAGGLTPIFTWFILFRRVHDFKAVCPSSSHAFSATITLHNSYIDFLGVCPLCAASKHLVLTLGNISRLHLRRLTPPGCIRLSRYDPFFAR